MKNMLSNINKDFFALVANERFSFDEKNFLKHTYDINFKYQIQNLLETNIDGNLINREKRDRLSIVLSGFGVIDAALHSDYNFSDKFLFVTSALLKKYDNQKLPKRKILFDYVFKDNDIPLENKISNLHLYNSSATSSSSAAAGQQSIPENLYYIPEIQVYIKEKHIVYDKKKPSWSLLLEEI